MNASSDTLLQNAPSKIARLLVYLRHFGALNRFEAARLVGDSCLNSTVSALETQYGIGFERQPEKSPNRWGAPCDVLRYSLPASQHEHADAAIARMFSRHERPTA